MATHYNELEEYFRSLRDSATICFTNRSWTSADVMWLDRWGRPTLRFTLLPGEHFRLFAYSELPWVAVDSDTGHRLLLNGASVFCRTCRRGTDNDQIDLDLADSDLSDADISVVVTSPVLSLKNSCFHTLRCRLRLTDHQLAATNIPASLLQEFRRCRCVAVDSETFDVPSDSTRMRAAASGEPL